MKRLLTSLLILSGFLCPSAVRLDRCPYQEIYIKQGVGVGSVGKDSNVMASGGIGWRSPFFMGKFPLTFGLDAMKWGDQETMMSGAWLKVIGSYSLFNVHPHGPYVGAGFSAGVTYRQYASFNPPYFLFWKEEKQLGLFGEAVVGYEWRLALRRCALVGPNPSKVDIKIPYRFFIEASLHQPTVVRKKEVEGYLPYLQVDLGLGF